jgi:hypothetical protein
MPLAKDWALRSGIGCSLHWIHAAIRGENQNPCSESNIGFSEIMAAVLQGFRL